MAHDPTIPPFPGSIGLTHLRVYDSLSPDGLCGGSAHVHFASSEMYYVLSGRGTVQTLTREGLRLKSLHAGMVAWFMPGTIHRLINDDGKLEILVPMQNAGLPEAGDFVLTFPEAILRDDHAYEREAALASSQHVSALDATSARRRRDLSIEGFHELLSRFRHDGESALQRFFEIATGLVRPRLERWRKIIDSGPAEEVRQTQSQIEALARGEASHLLEGRICFLEAAATSKLGMCGHLWTYQPEGTIA